MKKIILFLFVTFYSITTTFGQTKIQADSAYNNNDFVKATELYETILENQGESADIYYNLGNSYYKMDNIAKAILNYERALLLNPGDSDIRFNLELAQSKTVDKVVPISEMFFITWAKSFTNSLNEVGWSKIGIISFVFILLSLTLYFFGKKILFKKIGFIIAVSLFFICIIANVCASFQKKRLMKNEYAIIMVPKCCVYTL